MGFIYKGVKKGLLMSAGPVKAILGSVVAGELGKTVVPMIKDAVDDYQEQQKHLVTVPEVQGASIKEAKDFLQGKGFYVTEKLVTPSQAYAKKSPGDIIKLSPKSGSKVEPGSLVVIYYVDEAVIKASQDISIELMDVEGMSLERAKTYLEGRGLTVEICPLNPDRKYHLYQPDMVVKMSPKPSLFQKRVSGDHVIKLYTLSPQAIAKSQELAASNPSKQTRKTIFDHLKRRRKK